MSSRARQQDREALRRIAARLVALSDIAERASRRAWPVLWLVLWILRPAQAYARKLVIDVARDLGMRVEFPASEHLAPVLGGGRPDHALRLAMAFAMLAAALYDLAEIALTAPRRISPVSRQDILSVLRSLAPEPSRLTLRPCLPHTETQALAARGYFDTS